MSDVTFGQSEYVKVTYNHAQQVSHYLAHETSTKSSLCSSNTISAPTGHLHNFNMSSVK